MTKRVAEFGQGIRSPNPSLIFKASQAESDVFGSLVLPGSGRPESLGARMRFVSYGQNSDGSYSGFMEDDGEPEPYFHLYVAGGEYTVGNAADMREVVEGMKDRKRRAREKQLARQEELKKIPQRVADWRAHVFSQMKRDPKHFAMGGSNGK